MPAPAMPFMPSFDISAIVTGLDALGLQTLQVSSRAQSRKDYLRRPDLGRKLDAASQDLLASGRHGPCDLAVVIGDGLSPSAVNAHAVELVRQSHSQARRNQIELGPVLVASGARVALGDEIGALLGARMAAMLIGERPGLSAPHSLGAYLTFAPRAGCTDAMRNCVSNIHSSGLSYDEAAFKIAWLVREGLARQITGVALKDESGGQPAALSRGDRRDSVRFRRELRRICACLALARCHPDLLHTRRGNLMHVFKG